jgi:hypothetical protein
VSDGWTQTICRDVEVFKSPSHEDASGVYRKIERVFSIDEEDAKTLASKKPGALQAR